ncbi:hypothetical protein AAIG96_34590, partial [Pseudomonas aeruginosa]
LYSHRALQSLPLRLLRGLPPFQPVSLPTEPHPFSARPLLRLLQPPALLWWRLRHFQRLTLHYGGKPLHCLGGFF